MQLSASLHPWAVRGTGTCHRSHPRCSARDQVSARVTCLTGWPGRLGQAGAGRNLLRLKGQEAGTLHPAADSIIPGSGCVCGDQPGKHWDVFSPLRTFILKEMRKGVSTAPSTSGRPRIVLPCRRKLALRRKEAVLIPCWREEPLALGVHGKFPSCCMHSA